ncbi:hypothetical protein [Marinobacter sp. MMG032]|uniref:Uncharacterized protein n=1 Tax=Marinobacter sp. MMG032 TaxID=3158548 RepID=A0AAU7MS70_9GAMM
MKKITTTFAFSLVILGCASNGVGSGYNRSFQEADPVTGQVKNIYSIGLDNSTGSIFTAGSVGGRINIICSSGELTSVKIDPTSGLANGWLQIRFDYDPPYEIQGSNAYPYDVQVMNPEDAKRFTLDVVDSKSAVVKVGFSRGYKVMKMHLENLPSHDIRYSCGLS